MSLRRPHRCVSCPRLKWDDEIRKLCRIHFDACWHDVSIEAFSARMDDFVNYYSSRVLLIIRVLE